MRLLLLIALFPFIGFSQTTYTSTANGNFLDPLIWSPLGVPLSGDSVVINHAVVLNTDVYYTAGQIKINSVGSLIEDAMDRSFWADGTGSVVNAGTFTTHLLAISPAASFENYGNFIGIDSLWNQGSITNNPGGYATLYDFWNDQTGSFINSGVLSNADSLLNQGSFINNTSASIYDLLNDEMADFTNNGNLEIQNNMNNQGLVNNGASMVLYNDFSNCNTQNLDAMFINDGRFCIANDFLNCIDDTLAGTGTYYIGGSSSNLGVFDGSFIFYTPSGTVGIPGNIQPGVTVTSGSCNLGLGKEVEEAYAVYPNPTNQDISLSISGVSFELYDITGKVVQSGTVDNYSIEMGNLRKGVYLLKVEGKKTKRIVKQ